MLPVVAIVGRPNVGKSTLFNRLTRSRDALVADQPGLTRDRQYGTGKVGTYSYLVVDTGGLTGAEDDLARRTEDQTLQAVRESTVTLFVVDARDGLTAADQDIAENLRPFGKSVLLVVNKVDGLDERLATAEFHALGFDQLSAIAAAHGRGVPALMASAAVHFPADDATSGGYGAAGIKVAAVGRPNVGKSTLVNRLLGEQRVVVHDHPGTTRDSVAVPFSRRGKSYVLIDTAGVRRRARVTEKVEKFSIVKSLQAVEAADVAVVLIDAREGVTDQDAHLLSFVLEVGRALVLAVNKWDAVDPERQRTVRDMVKRKLAFVEFAPVHFISALHGSGVGRLFDSVQTVWRAASRDLSTPVLTRILRDAIGKHPPPLVRGRRIKLRYAHQGGRCPPAIVVHGNQTDDVPASYRKYLAGAFRRALGLVGTPVRLEFRTSDNPFKGRKNVLTPRQARKRARLLKHVKG